MALYFPGLANLVAVIITWGIGAVLLLIGTGLTMVDTAISLLDREHTGTIHALSRRGLMPRGTRRFLCPQPC